MKRTINEHDFIDAFQGTYKNQFSYEGKIALYEYLTQLEEDTGFEMELDAIAICCDFAEYEDFTEFLEDYKDYAKENGIRTIEDIWQHTQLIRFNGSKDDKKIKHSFIIQQF